MNNEYIKPSLEKLKIQIEALKTQALAMDNVETIPYNKFMLSEILARYFQLEAWLVEALKTPECTCDICGAKSDVPGYARGFFDRDTEEFCRGKKIENICKQCMITINEKSLETIFKNGVLIS